MDQYIPLAQRQQGVALAKSLDGAQAAAPTPAAKPVSPPIKTVSVPASEPTKPAAMAKPVPTPKPAPATKPAPPAKPAPALAAKAAPAKPTASASAASGWRVQLGAYGTEAKARTAWSGISGRAGLKGLEPAYVKAGAVTRLQAGGFSSRSAANQACKAAAVPCFAIAH
jgi:hypothetical protein